MDNDRRANNFDGLIDTIRTPPTPSKTGYFFECCQWDVNTTKISISIAKLSLEGTVVRYKRKFISVNPRSRKRDVWSYEGFCRHYGNTTIINYVNTTKRQFSGTLYLLDADHFSGDLIVMKTAATSTLPWRPFSTPVYLKFLGEKIDLRAHLHLCKLHDSSETLPDILTEMWDVIRTRSVIIGNISALNYSY